MRPTDDHRGRADPHWCGRAPGPQEPPANTPGLTCSRSYRYDRLSEDRPISYQARTPEHNPYWYGDMHRAAPTAPHAHAPVLVRPSAKPPITPYITRGIPAQHGGVREYPGSLIRPPGTPTGPPDRTVPTIVRPRRWTNPGGVGSGARSRYRRSTARTSHGCTREDSPITTQTLGGRPWAPSYLSW